MGISQQIGASSQVKWGVCTSSTRPASPYHGQHIYETDTNLQYVWNGTAWVNNYASSASPALTGIPTAPTAAVDTNTTQLATTAYVVGQGYAKLANPTFSGTVSGITKTMVGLGSVDNTADTAKPVSTAQQTALNLKANLSGAAFTGVTTNSATPSFYAYHAASGNAGSGVQIFSVVHTNRGSCYNSSNGRFTASVAGNYLFVSSLLSLSTGIVNGELQKNGATHQYGEMTRGSGAGGYVQAIFCSVMNMAVGDYAQINTGAYAVYGYSYSSFSGFFIG